VSAPSSEPPGAKSSAADTVETEVLLTRAVACTKRGEIAQAEKQIRQVLARDPRHVGALLELGRIAFVTGDKRAAADCLRKAIASEPGNGKLHNELGSVLIGLGERQEALRAFARALEIEPGDPDAITNMGSFHLGDGRLKEAVAAYRRALEIDPLNMNARVNIDVALKKGVPLWHFSMMNDVPRNAAFGAAIRRVVPGRSVLDIGTGAGLLAMMAARAGAKWVVSCEGIPWIAAKARDVVAANGLSDRIKLIAKRSADLRTGVDLPERAEVLVMEVFGTTVLNEHVIATVTHAHAQLLRPGATVVPNAASARAYLAGGSELEGYFFVDRAVGFTLTEFNDFAQLSMDLNANYFPHDVLSDDFEVLHFDFTQPPAHKEKQVIDVVATRAGRCCGVVQWLRLDLLEGLVYENRPGRRTAVDGWAHMLHRFSQPIKLKAGDRVRLLAQHNGYTLLISDLPANLPASGPQAGRDHESNRAD
jgi:protein arginine N-methyltransferase 7